MSRYVEDLKSSFVLSRTKKITDCKKAVKLILGFYETEESDHATICQEQVTWEEIFNVVHDLVVFDADYHKSKDKEIGNDKILSLIQQTAQKAKNLSMDQVVDAASMVLHDRSLAIYWNVYLDILRKNVLKDRAQRIQIKPELWENLLKVVTSILKKVDSRIAYGRVFETAELIVRYGCQLASLLPGVKKLLSVITKVLQNLKQYAIGSYDSLFKLLSALCHEIAIDTKLALCKFFESMPQFLIREKGPEEKCKLYLLLLKLQDEKSNPDNKKIILDSLYHMIIKDLKPEKLNQSFLELASEVFRQRIETNLPMLDTDYFDQSLYYTQPKKRRRVEDERENLIDMINVKDLKQVWPIVQIVIHLCTTSPKSLKVDNYFSLFDTITKQMNLAIKEVKVMESLCQLACIVIRILEKYGLSNIDKNCLDKVWDLSVKYITMADVGPKVYGHQLVQKLIKEKNMSNPKALLLLYLNKSINCSRSSLQTLSVFCETYEEIVSTEKHQLLEWVLGILKRKSLITIPLDILSEILVRFILKVNFKSKDSKSKITLFDDYTSVTLDDIIYCHSSQQLNNDLFNYKLEPESARVETDQSEIPFSQIEFDFLIAHILGSLNKEDIKRDFSLFVTKVALALKVTSDLYTLNVPSGDLIDKLELWLELICEELLQLSSPKEINLKDACDIMKSLEVLFCLNYDDKINGVILASIKLEHIKKLNQYTKIPVDKYFNLDHNLALQCRMNIYRIITNYICLNAGNPMSQLQLQMVNTILKLDKYDLASESDVEIVFIILEILVDIPDTLVTDSFLYLLERFILEIYVEWASDDKVSKGLLRALPLILRKASLVKFKITNILKVFADYCRFFNKQKFGQVVQATLWRSLNDIATNEFVSENLTQSFDLDFLIHFAKSPFYFVRLESIKYIFFVLSSKFVEFERKVELFKTLAKLPADIFEIDVESPQDITLEDEQFTRTVTVMQLFANMILSNSALQNSALLCFIKIVKDKFIDFVKVKKLLQIVSENLNLKNDIQEENLEHLLSYWCKQSTLDSFPFQLLNCTGKTEFYQRFDHLVFPVLYREGRLSEAQAVYESLNTRFENLFESHCSKIIPSLLAGDFPMAFDKLKKNTDEFRKVKELNVLVDSNLDKIICNLVQRLHDEQNFKSIFAKISELAESEPPVYDADKISYCLRVLQKIYLGDSSSDSLFNYLIDNKPDVLQKVLLKLSLSINDKRCTLPKIKALHQYAYFCMALLTTLNAKSSKLFSFYIIRDIGHTLIHLLKGTEFAFVELVCQFIYKFLEGMLPLWHEGVKIILDDMVRSLASLIERYKEFQTPQRILELLFVKHKTVFEKEAKNFAALPGVNFNREEGFEFDDLEDYVEKFLTISDDKSCNVNNLVVLKQLLKSKLNQNFPMYRLIHRLIKLTVSMDAQASLEAAKCLGTIGPTDLGTTILHSKKHRTKLNIDSLDLLTLEIALHLVDFLISPDFDLREVSSQALYAIFNLKCGYQIVNNGLLRESVKPLHQYLYPFLQSSSKLESSVTPNVSRLRQIFCKTNDFWCKIDGFHDHGDWAKRITFAICNCIEGGYFKNLMPVFLMSPQFCESILPYVVNFVITSAPGLTDDICQCINEFFECHFSQDAAPANCPREIVQCMLNVVNHLRIQRAENIQLNFNYLVLAKGAQFCLAYFSSILYAELWCTSYLKNPKYFDEPLIEQIGEGNPVYGNLVQELLRQAYVSIGDEDSAHGCGFSHLESGESRLRYFINSRKYDEAMLSCDVDLSFNCASLTGMGTALMKSSLYYLTHQFANNFPTDSTSATDVQYDALWRLGDWSKIVPKSPFKKKEEDSFAKLQYQALKSLQENDRWSSGQYLNVAYSRVTDDLRNMSLECCNTVYPKLAQLRMLQDIEDWMAIRDGNYENLLQNWDQQEFMLQTSFDHVEPILSQRSTLFSSNAALSKALIANLLRIAKLSREQGYLNFSARALETLKRINNLTGDIRNLVIYEEAHLAWQKKEEDVAKYYLRKLTGPKITDLNLRARALRTYGNWIAENKSENPQIIKDKYYKQSVEVFRASNLSDETAKNKNESMAVLAQFCHEQYLRIVEYMNSSQFEFIQQCTNYSKKQGALNISDPNMNQDLKRAVLTYERFGNKDSTEIANTKQECEKYALDAIDYYLKVLQNSDDHDNLIYRLISLWLDNMSNDKVNRLCGKKFGLIPSCKFIPLVPQLAPHLSDVENVIFSDIIFKLLYRCAIEHSHHTLPVLLALKNLYNDAKYCTQKVDTPEPRVLGAQKLISKLKETRAGPVIQEIDQLSNAIVTLAYFPNKNHSGSFPIPNNQPLHLIKNFRHSYILTINVDVRRDQNYHRDIISVRKYAESFSKVGGVNGPKKLICHGSDGKSRAQMIKGKDDLRQDAVMQQVFTVMNSLLGSSKEAKQKNLHVKTYKIVPLTQRSGVLQWCDNTLPLCTILYCMHKKYHPQDLTVDYCRLEMDRVGKTTDFELRYTTYKKCCNGLRPAFHHYFSETYRSPEIWFQRRIAYTRSVATTSIIGYVLGLGDRHVSNILLDERTAEVVHIDFGIAFEQGKILPTPETVPFRLSRDIEVAMGVSGAEGTMKRCCITTMTVLREHREIIVTLLRVLLYDPLYSWAITPQKAATFQNENSVEINSGSQEQPQKVATETNKLAERALLRVQQKLQGIEDGYTSSIPGQIERLIQEAKDPMNLCRLYYGWQAYL